MMKNLLPITGLVGLLAAGVCWILAGCENNQSVAGSDFYIDPPNAVLTPDSPSVSLTAVGGHEPYTWTVTDSSLGTVTGGGTDVTYTRTGGNGVNTVIVTDGLGWTASASMSHQDTVTNTPFVDPYLEPDSATLDSDGDKVYFSAYGGEAPYSWDVGDDTRGDIDPTGRDQAVYTRLASGNNSVILYDSEGRVFVAHISQPLAATLAISPANCTLGTNVASQVFTAAGGSGSYTWSINSGPGGMSPGSGSSSVLNVPAGTSATIVSLKDSDGNEVFATVTRN
jgi:hypothetical protein